MLSSVLPTPPSDISSGSKMVVGSLVSRYLISVEDAGVSFIGMPVCGEAVHGCVGVPVSLADIAEYPERAYSRIVLVY